MLEHLRAEVLLLLPAALLPPAVEEAADERRRDVAEGLVDKMRPALAAHVSQLVLDPRPTALRGSRRIDRRPPSRHEDDPEPVDLERAANRAGEIGGIDPLAGPHVCEARLEALA